MDHVDSEPPHVANFPAKQRECFHLAVLRKFSEEIVHILQILTSAVEQLLVNARRITRDQATLIYAGAAATGQRTSYDPRHGAFDALLSAPHSPEERPNSFVFEEVLCAPDTEQDLNLCPKVGTKSDGNWGLPQRMAIMGMLMIGVLAIVLIGLSVFQSLSRLLGI